jgi:hypothetical protein
MKQRRKDGVPRLLLECHTTRWIKRREALGKITSASSTASTKSYFYCFNVNRTSLDHLLLGEHADVDKSVE